MADPTMAGKKSLRGTDHCHCERVGHFEDDLAVSGADVVVLDLSATKCRVQLKVQWEILGRFGHRYELLQKKDRRH